MHRALSTAGKPREPRQSVRLSVRYKTDTGWDDALIRNVSSRGMMAVCASPPDRGTYVEIRRGDCAIIGRVAWASNDRFGVRTQDEVDLARLAGVAEAPRDYAGERRKADRAGDQRRRQAEALENAAANSARFSRLFDFAIIAGAVAAGALFLADSASAILSAPLEQVALALGEEAP